MENKVDLLDHGFVRLVDSMGDDDRIVQAEHAKLQSVL